jgi:CBS domain-containing protein
MKDVFGALKATTPFCFLSDQVIREIVDQSEIEKYPQGSYIFREGDQSKQTLYFILDGQAKALAKIGGKESVTTIRNAGDFFGVTVLLLDDPYPVSMFAVNDLTCLLIKRETFQKALYSSDNRFADYFTQALAARLKELYQTFSDNKFNEQFIQEQTMRRRVADIYSGKVITALPMDKISDVAKKMSQANVSSVVVKAFNGKPIGIITGKDLVGKVLSGDNPDLDRKAHEIMSDSMITVRPGDFTYQALLKMIKHNVSHIVVTDEHAVLHGIVTIKDLIRTGNSGALSIVRQIEHKDCFGGLAEVIREVDLVQQALLTERSYASEICAIISELYDRVTRKVVQIAEKQMIDAGWGPPPTMYAFISMGSAGRKEQFSRTDQDNGIIFADSHESSADLAANYFLALGKKIVEGLEICGFKRCPGEVMADNPNWCLPLSMWKNRMNLWVDKLDPKDIREMTIFLDYRYIAGDAALPEDLKNYSTKLFREAKHALLFLAEDDLRQKVPLTMFGKLITENAGERKKKLNLKSTSMVHMVDCLRLFALREGVRETNSFERIHRLKERGVFKTGDAEYIEAAYESLLMFRIKAAVEKMRLRQEPDQYIDLTALSRKEKALLKESLLVINRLQSLTAHAFHVHKA